MQEIYDKIKAVIVAYLGHEPTNIDLEIQIMVDMCINYMNRDDFPLLLVNIVAKEMIDNINKGSDDAVTKIKEGDTEITFDVSGVGEQTFYNITPQLQKWRKIRVR